ncbi:uncharacterized protein HMPREF1541_08177 [Cyphellophora europaea CBS 101466]|uniref:Oxidoreductase NAD-binding domain-containing protein 1 n=1 Tax=Cyphellophora europaea (strain CBS 101466) TaxID=1220924 RepID=W2RL16_CYPE1|nr:uncharacterized protein HMPREF1541_08177 [Cyphellophora europaea CBS 101466]ETN37187.1 hypothetical protein HMPREF1541_08177 [Cyphellophora europaea CBS 101466]
MANVREDSIPHVVRTAHEQRQAGVWNATVSQIDEVNSSIRLIRLGIVGAAPERTHLPGQYIDLSIPSIPTIGGFTITSPPLTTRDPTSPHIELAIQRSPNNPPAAYLWRATPDILHAPVSFLIGGNFVYPPAHLTHDECSKIDRAVFVAGGVGINPIMSMLSAMHARGGRKLGGMPRRVSVLYTCRRGRDAAGEPEKVLFEDRLAGLAQKWAGSEVVEYRYTFFETSGQGRQNESSVAIRHQARRIRHDDLLEAIGPEDDRANTVVYVCGLPAMTDEFVELLKTQPGLSEKQVCCEKWW